MLVYLRDRPAQTRARAATLRYKVQIKLSVLSSHSILTPRPTSPIADPMTPGAWQGSHWSASFEVTGMTPPGKIPVAQAGIEPGIFRSRGERLSHWANEAVYCADRNALGTRHLLFRPQITVAIGWALNTNN